MADPPWELDFAEKWGLPEPAADELRRRIADVAAGRTSPGDKPLDSIVESMVPEEVRTLHADESKNAARYEDLGLIAKGAMGEVRRVWDFELNRSVAMKIVRKEFSKSRGVISRFKGEAQATAQLEHPVIVPIYDVGTLPDGRSFFVMKEVRGRTLGEVISEVHEASEERWETSATGWTIRGLVDAFKSVCEAVAYAHTRAVVHRDLKPDNIMVGAFGEVVLMDWGVARILGQTVDADLELTSAQADVMPVVTDRSAGSAFRTKVGSVAGTPAYMPPEQAAGDHAMVGPWSDVYALGAVLYHILSDRPPFTDRDGRRVVDKLLRNVKPRHVGRRKGPTIDPELVGICETAMNYDIARRYMDAMALVEALDGWLLGSRQRERAMVLVEQADAALESVRSHRAQAHDLRNTARALLSGVAPWEAPARKTPGWVLQDEARKHDDEANKGESTFLQLLQQAMTHAPDLNDIHDRLSAFLVADLGPQADPRATLHVEAIVRAHDTGQFQAWLDGDGFLTLHTDPPGAQVTLLKVEEVGRRLVPIRAARKLDRTPLDRVKLPMGSYVLRLRARGCAAVDYPVLIGRQEHWSGVPPEADVPQPIPLPAHGAIEPSERYVPAGWHFVGGDVEAADTLRGGRVWTDAFVIQRFPVTNAAYLAFLDTVLPDDARKAHFFAPIGMEHDATGFELGKWDPEQPVRGVPWEGAVAYAAWYAEQTDVAWRLPTEVEWEKAARGVDARQYPFGNRSDGTFCCTMDSAEAPIGPSPVDSYPLDNSPYGVRGLGGNVRDFVWGSEGEPSMVRGGWWDGLSQFARASLRYRQRGPHRGVGFRLVRSLT